MKRLAILFVLIALWLGQSAYAQGVLSSVSFAGSAMSSAISIDYRYTRHTGSTGGRGGRTYTYYTWDPHTDQAISTTVPTVLNGTTGNQISTGTFYAPTYHASFDATTSLTNSSTAVFAGSYKQAMVLNTPQVAHQRVAVSAQCSSSLYFTIADDTAVKIETTGSANGMIRVISVDGNEAGIGGLTGPVTYSTVLAGGIYRLEVSVTDSALQDTQANLLTNIGTKYDTYTFTVTFTAAN